MLIDEVKISEAESYFFAIICPNNKGETPIDIAIKARASRSVEIMLDMLS